MIPKKLTIQGIYSYQKKQTIDFTTLTRAGLFGLFGSVGSGKSTILEAISFALFGQSERLNARDNRNYNMMNLKSNELFIDFEFTSGNDIYRFMVQGKRNSRKFDDVKKLERTAFKKENDEWKPIHEDSAPEITGLSYDNFHRTIIIPQGKFQEFLQLTAKDRTNMLRELFNLNKFELYYRVADLDRENDRRLQNLNGQLESIGPVDKDETKKLEEELKNTSETLKTSNETLKSLQDQVKSLEKVRDLQNKLKQYKDQQAKLLKEKETIDQQNKELKEYEAYTRIFKSDLELSNRLAKDHKNIETGLTRAKEDLKKRQDKYNKIQAAFEKTRQEWQYRDKWLRKAEELEKMAGIRKLQAEIVKEQERKKKGTRMLTENQKFVVKLKAQQNEAKEKLTKKKKSLPDLKMLADVREWFAQSGQLIKEQKDTALQLKLIKEETEGFQKQIKAIPAQSELTLPPQATVNIDHLNAAITSEKQKLETEKLKLDEKWHHLQVQQQLMKYAHELEEGKPCPLCGSQHHPDVLQTGDVSEQLKNIQENRRKAEKRQKHLTETETQLLRISDRLNALGREQQRYSDNLETITAQIRQHQKKFQWKNFSPDNETQVKESFKQHEIISKKIAELESTIEKIASETEKAEANKEKYHKILEDIIRSIVDKKSRIDILSDQFRETDPVSLKAISTDELMQKAGSLKKQYTEIEKRYQKEEKQIAETGKELDSLTGQIETREKQLVDVTNELMATNERISELLKEHGAPDRSTVAAIIFKPLNVDAIRKGIELYFREVSTVGTTIKQNEEELNGRSFDEKKYFEETTELKKLSQRIEDLNRAWGETKNKLEELKVKLKKAEVLKKEHDKIQERADDLKMMKNLFKGGAFVNYISTVYLQELIRAANQRFYRLTRQHLSLELTSDNSFQVRDFMNEGHVRSVKTLSGGQTFQASLSLALALADSIQKHTSTSGNFFFLDEGFGTLDRESLGIVFDTLKSLRHENRIVGVISHVEEMQQEIETYLHIDNDEEKGSQIKASWEK
jgi:exonuclease SbcC